MFGSGLDFVLVFNFSKHQFPQIFFLPLMEYKPTIQVGGADNPLCPAAHPLNCCYATALNHFFLS